MSSKFKNEKELQKELASRLKKYRDSIKLEVPVGEKKWRIDILTEREIIECKPKLNRSTCFQATSQLELYQRYYPDRRLVVAASEIDQSARDILKAKGITFWSVRPRQRKVYSDKSTNAHKILADKQKQVAQAEMAKPARQRIHVYEVPDVKPNRPLWPYVAAIVLVLIAFGSEFLRQSQISGIGCFSTASGTHVKTLIKPETYIKVLETSSTGRTKVSLPGGSQCWVDSERITNP